MKINVEKNEIVKEIIKTISTNNLTISEAKEILRTVSYALERQKVNLSL